jgi:hypothetical protein
MIDSNGYQTLSNKDFINVTIADNKIRTSSKNILFLPDLTDSIVTLTATQMLSNKTLFEPILFNN